MFYDWQGTINGEARNWGHMGLSLSDGRIVHAWDVLRIDEIKIVESLPVPPGGSQPIYTGWAPPKIFLQGMSER